MTIKWDEPPTVADKPRMSRPGYWIVNLTGTVNGKEQKSSKSVGRTEAEAVANTEAMRAEMKKGVWRAPDDTTLVDWIEFVISHDGKLAKGSIKRYHDNTRLHIAPHFGDTKLQKVTALKISDLWAKMRADGYRQSLIHSVYVTLSKAFNAAQEAHLIVDNPARTKLARVPSIKLTKGGYRSKIIEEEPLLRLFQLLRGHAYEDILHFAYFTGVRLGEVYGLTWRQIDLAEGVVIIDQQKHRDNEITPPKGGKMKEFDIPAPLLDMLRRRRAEAARVALARQEPLAGLAVFPVRSYVALSSAVRKLCRRAGIKGRSMHSFRHTFGTVAITSGLDPATVAEMMGHHSAGFTLNNYVSVTRARRRQAAAHVGANFFDPRIAAGTTRVI
jgi:integrase